MNNLQGFLSKTKATCRRKHTSMHYHLTEVLQLAKGSWRSLIIIKMGLSRTCSVWWRENIYQAHCPKHCFQNDIKPARPLLCHLCTPGEVAKVQQEAFWMPSRSMTFQGDGEAHCRCTEGIILQSRPADWCKGIEVSFVISLDDIC